MPVGVALAAILVLSAALRLCGINFGLPFPYHPDEPFLVEMARTMLRTGNLDPPLWDYPSVQVYSLLAAMVYRQVLSPVLPFLAPDWMDYLDGRLLSVAYALATVCLIYRIGRRQFGEGVGLLAAAFLGFSALHSYNSHFLTVDVPATFFVTLTLAAALAIVERPRPAAYVLAGVAAGLAISTKYTVGSLLFLLLVAHVAAGRRQVLARSWLLLLAFAGAVIGFAITSPYAWIDPSHFLRSFAERDVTWAATPGAAANSVAWSYLSWLFAGRDAPVAWIGAAGVALGAWRRDRKVLLLCAFPVLYVATLMPWQVSFSRYLLPIMPFLALIAGWLVVEARRLLPVGRDGSRLWAGAALLVLAVQFGLTADQSTVFAQEDVRTTALHWIEANVPAGSTVVREDFTPFLPRDRYRVISTLNAIDLNESVYTSDPVQYVVLSSYRAGVFLQDPARYPAQVRKYRRILASGRRVAHFEGPFVGIRGSTIDVYELAP